MTGTCWPSLVSTLKKALPKPSTLICPTAALLMTILKTVPAGRLTDDACTSSRRRPLSSNRHSLKPAGVTPLMAAPESVAWMRVSLNSSALTVLSFKMNGIITQKAANSKTANTLNKFLFLAVCFILLPSNILLFFYRFLKCFGGTTSRETRLSNGQCRDVREKDSRARNIFEKEKSQPR